MSVTVKDIAARMGISYSTVAYALSGKGTINEETRERVRNIASEMGYIPNLVARSFRGKRCRTAGVVVPNLTSGYNEVVQELFFCCEEAGWDVQTVVTQHLETVERRHLERFFGMRLDAILLRGQFEQWESVPAGHPLRLAEANGLPLVLWGRNPRGAPFPAIIPDYEKQMALILDYLRGRGYASVAYVQMESGALSRNTQEEIDCFRRLTRELWPQQGEPVVLSPEEMPPAGRGLQGAHDRHNSRFSLAPGASVLRRARALKKQPRALVCRSEMLALGVIHEALAQGVRVPEDVAVAALTRNLTAQCSPLPLTTVDFPPVRVAQAALEVFRRLTERAERGGRADGVRGGRVAAPARVAVVPELIAGESA